ncbi:EAL domain-containing protein [Marinibacterium sp. SX1]|uniref:EAL domain-containing protein n=1 Tax=Marinibacterium sp. SX1 TaxID=3388424 RepID=UPI003D16D61E
MTRNRKRRGDLADITDGATSPLDVATTARAGQTLDMVRAAVERGDTMLAFQPVLGLRPPHGTAFYEGLIRVLDPTGRVIPARDFITVVEPTELGREIDCDSLDKALKTLAQVPEIRLSVNMSARSIGYRRWMRTLDKGLKRHPTVAERLILEISESSAIALPELVADFMMDLQLKGIAFALDDFGAGLSAVGQFRSLLFDMVKIHGQFVRGVHANRDNQAVTTALVGLARSFDMYSIATRVEDERDAAWLADIGVDCIQGHLYGAPSVRPPWIEAMKKARRA